MELATIPAKPALPALHVIVDFGGGIPSDVQGCALLMLEKWLRERGIAAECFKHTMPDDSKLRRSMTAEQRSRL